MLTIAPTHYLVVAAVIFYLNFLHLPNPKNVIVILMSVELLLLAVNINFVAFQLSLIDLVGSLLCLFLTVAAAEAAIGLAAFFVIYHRNRGTISALDDINMMKGRDALAIFLPL